MLKSLRAFSGFSVDDLSKAKEFYVKTLDLEIESEEMGLGLKLPGGGRLFIYEKKDHKPATYTALNFVVENIDVALDALVAKGVKFEHYGSPDFKQDEKGIARGLSVNMGPDIAWFKDPAENIISILQDE